MNTSIARTALSLSLSLSLTIQFLAIPLLVRAQEVDTSSTSSAPAAEQTNAPESSAQSADTEGAAESGASTQAQSTAHELSTQETQQQQQESAVTQAPAQDEATSSQSAPPAEPLITSYSTSTSAEVEHASSTSSGSESGFVSASTSSIEEDTASSSDSQDPSSSQSRGTANAAQANQPATTSNPMIASGDAIAIANILNFLNTSFINSSGGILVSNFVNVMPTIDLRDVSLFTGMCGPVPCMGQNGIQINLLQDATINNDIILNAMSGRNFASGVMGESSTTAIETGNAFAGLNLINLANTTFVNANYMLVTLNAFSGANGDIIFPSLRNFFDAITGRSSVAEGSTFTNDASVTNDVTAGAESGANVTEGADTSVIASGSSGAYTNVFNQLNNTLPDTRVSILFRIAGNWTGQMYGVPDNVSQVRGPDGSIFLFGASSTQSGSANLIHSTTTAGINNRVNVSALSGQNGVSNASTSLISTGNAFAGANIINIANQNVIGRNWILAIINIFGDFNGNISFGRPDLWIGAQVDAPGTVGNGSELAYKITVINNGDSDAHNVRVSEMPDWDHVTIGSASLPYTQERGSLVWDVGVIPAGKAVEISYKATVKNAPQGFDITTTSSVNGVPSDNNPSDNTDTLTVRTSVMSPGGGIGGSYYGSVSSAAPVASPALASSTADFRLHIQRITDRRVADAKNPIVAQQVVVTNRSDYPIRNAVMHDILRSPLGSVIHDEVWQLDTIAPQERVIINYDIAFASSAPGGMYILTTELESKEWPTASYANGSIEFKPTMPGILGTHTSGPPVRIANRKATAAPTMETIDATSTPSMDLPNLKLTAAAAVVGRDASSGVSDLVLFLLFFATSYGILRYFARATRLTPLG